MKILPFRGYRYNTQKISCLDDVISLPYDQFKNGWDKRFHGRHPYNISHIIMNPESPEDTRINNRYTRSRKLLNSWINEDIFIRDDQPCLYPYYQEYRTLSGEYVTRKGIVALGEISDYSQEIVFPHEQTLTKPKEDRLKLLRSTLLDSGLIFMLYSDPIGRVEEKIDQLVVESASWSAKSNDSIKNKIWKISDSSSIASIQKLLQEKSVIIADGHHRYEVAREFKKESSKKVKHDIRWNSYSYKLINLIRMESPALTIRPIHRILFNLEEFDGGTFLNNLKKFFIIKPIKLNLTKKKESINNLLLLLKKEQGKGSNTFGVFIPSLNLIAILSLNPSSMNLVKWPSNKSLLWRKLDVSILQVIILNYLLGIGENELAKGNKVEYVSNSLEAFDKVKDLKGQCLFWLNPTPIGEVKAVVHSQDLLPQKSTHFHPKLMEGLIFAKHL